MEQVAQIGCGVSFSRYAQDPPWMPAHVIYCREPSTAGVVGLDELQMSIPTLAILRFCVILFLP